MTDRTAGGPGPGKTPAQGSVTPGPACGHDRSLLIVARDGTGTAWCFVCEEYVTIRAAG